MSCGCTYITTFLRWIMRETDGPVAFPTESIENDKITYLEITKVYPFSMKCSSLSLKQLEDPNRPPAKPTKQFEVIPGQIPARLPINYEITNDICETTDKLRETLSEEEKYYELPPDIFSCSMKAMIMCHSFRDNEMKAWRFLKYATSQMTPEISQMIAEETFYQGFHRIWLLNRYGRLTTIDFCLAATFGYPEQSFEYQCLTNYEKLNFPEPYILDDQRPLRAQILKVIKEQIGDSTIDRSGVVLNGKYPFLMATPDAISETGIIHIGICDVDTFNRCENVFDVSQIDRANLQMEMVVCERALGYYCLIHPEFETNQKIKIFEEDADPDFIQPLIGNALGFWINGVFPVLAEV